jgi:prepilin-type processing-associated H-X9-DG protein
MTEGAEAVTQGQAARRRISVWAVLAFILAMTYVLAVACYSPQWKPVLWPMMCVCGLGALVLGIVALMDIPRLPDWWRLVFGAMAATGILVGGFALLTWHEPCHLRESAIRASCKSNLRQIGLACHLYADDHGELFPPNLKSLVPEYLDNPLIFNCPSTRSQGRYRNKSLQQAAAESQYTYVGAGIRTSAPASVILAYDKSLDHHDKEGHPTGRNVLFADAHVEWWPVPRERELRKRLASQASAAKGK